MIVAVAGGSLRSRLGRAAPWVALVAILGAWFLSMSAFGVLAGTDTTRDFLMARACVDQGACTQVGPRTSIPLFAQGGLWPLLLAGLSPLGMEGIQAVTLLLLFLSLAGLAVLGARLAGPAAGFLAVAASILAGRIARDEGIVLWNATLLALPATLLIASALAAASDDERPGAGWIPPALALSLLVQLHPVGLAFVPFVAALYIRFRPRRHLAAWGLAALAAFVLPWFLTSWEAVVQAVRALSEAGSAGSGTAIPAGSGVAAIVAGGMAIVWAAVRFWPSASSSSAAVRVVLADLSFGPAAVVFAGLAVTGRAFETHYAIPLRPGLALAAAWGTAWSVRALAARSARSIGPVARQAATWAAVGLVALAVARDPALRDVEGAWTMADVRTLAGHLQARGVCTYEDAVRRIVGADAYLLLSSLQYAGRFDGPCTPEPDATPLLVHRVPAWSDGPGPDNAVDLPARGGGRLRVRPLANTLGRPGAARIERADGRSEAVRRGLDPVPIGAGEPGYPAVRALAGRERIRSLAVSYPVAGPTAGSIRIVPCGVPAWAGYKVREVTAPGLPARAGPGGSLVLEALAPGQTGSVEVVWESRDTAGATPRFLPAVLQIPGVAGDVDVPIEDWESACSL